MIQKQKSIRSSALTRAAKGEECTLAIAGVCNYDPSTTVLCHLPSEQHGMARKSDDHAAVIGCNRCHDVIDGRDRLNTLSEADWYFYTMRALFRTWRRWMDKELVIIKGRHDAVRAAGRDK